MQPQFRPHGSAGSEPSNFSAPENVLKKGVPHKWIRNYLKTGAETKLRMIPAFYEGQMELPLNPDGGEVDAAIGRCFFKAEVVQFLGKKKLTMVTSVSGDSAGNPSPDRWSPAKAGMRRLRYKMEEQQLKRQLNMPIDIPHPWFQWMRGNGGVREPADLWLLQGMCYENNGQIKQNQGTVEWVQPIVFGIPVSAQEDFFEQITTRHNPDATLGPENNRFGDFCSPDHGRMLEVYKRTKGEGNKKKTEYRIRPGNSVPVAADHMAGLWMDWDKLIHIPTIEESIGQLIESFDGVAVDYALRESSYHDYVPEEFRGSSDNIMNADNIQDLRNARPKVGYQPPPGQGAPQAPPPPPPPPADDIPYNNAPPTPAPQAPAPPAAPQAAPPTPAPQAPAQAPPTPAPPTPAPAAPEQVPTVQGEVVDSTSMAPTAPPPGVDPAKFQGALEKMGQHQNNE